MRFDYTALPARVLFGRGRVAEVADEVRRLGAKRALVLSTPGHRALGERVAALLGDVAAGVYANATMHTPVDVTEDALATLDTLWRALPLPRSLEAIGMPASGIDATADLVMRDAYPNPRPLERAPIVDMLTRAFSGAGRRMTSGEAD